MKSTMALAAVTTFLVMAVVPAAAIEVQGTWATTLKCTAYPEDADASRETEVAAAFITQSGESIVLSIPDFLLLMVGVATDQGGDPARPMKGVIAAGTCSSGASVGGLFAKVKVDPDGAGSLNGTFVGASLFGPFTCSVKATRTSTIQTATPLPCN